MKRDEMLRMVEDQAEEEQPVERARHHLVRAFVQLLNASPGDGLHWTGTKTDLLEAVYIVFTDGSAYDERGERPTFADLARRACDVFHVDMPANPRAYVNRAHARKGTFMRPLLERYRLMLCTGANAEPLSRFVCCHELNPNTGRR